MVDDDGSDHGDRESSDRRRSGRHDVIWSVDCETDDTFLYASISNISVMGIFVQTIDPLPIETSLTLRFSPASPLPSGKLFGAPVVEFVLRGTVQWINWPTNGTPNPGMGVRFVELSDLDRERILETVRTIAFVREELASDPTGDATRVGNN